MLTSLRFTNFRGFERYRLEGLTRVNLFVGVNHASKSAVLEGSEILLTRDTGIALGRVASRRHELIRDGVDQRQFADVRHLFHGHEPRLGTSFRVDAETEAGPRHVLVQWSSAADIDL